VKIEALLLAYPHERGPSCISKVFENLYLTRKPKAGVSSTKNMGEKRGKNLYKDR
jgi:hypothetical protein